MNDVWKRRLTLAGTAALVALTAAIGKHAESPTGTVVADANITLPDTAATPATRDPMMPGTRSTTRRRRESMPWRVPEPGLLPSGDLPAGEAQHGAEVDGAESTQSQ